MSGDVESYVRGLFQNVLDPNTSENNVRDSHSDLYVNAAKKQNMALCLLASCWKVLDPETPEDEVHDLCMIISNIMLALEEPEASLSWPHGYRNVMLELCKMFFATAAQQDEFPRYVATDMQKASALQDAFIKVYNFPFWNPFYHESGYNHRFGRL